MATIKDVAKLAQVSPSTVSRVIANNQRISPATHERVKQAMAELQYYPNMIARSLIKRSCNTIALVLSRSAASAFANPFFPEIIRGISEATQQSRYNLVLATARDYNEEAAEALRLLEEKSADGLLLLASRINDPLIRNLTDKGFPFVVVGRVPETEEIYEVNNDNIQAAYEGVRHLINLGHQQIALLNGPEDYTVCLDRFQGYRLALQEAGYEIDPAMITHGLFSQEDGYRSSRKLLSLERIPTAIFAVDDLMALGAYRAVKEAGMSIPDDISIIGFNDDPLAQVVEPALTTIRIPIFEMGETAAKMLIQILNGVKPPQAQRIWRSELVIRDSCGPVKG